MHTYGKILLAVELGSESDNLICQKSQELAKEYQAELYMIHAIEHLSGYGAAYGVSAGADIETMLMESAREGMGKLATKYGVADNNQFIHVGPAKIIILEEAKRLKADLIIVGSHGRHGIRLLLGSTANAVLHGAECDVLAVRLREEK